MIVHGGGVEGLVEVGLRVAGRSECSGQWLQKLQTPVSKVHYQQRLGCGEPKWGGA
jgi:hypothetical protein